MWTLLEELRCPDLRLRINLSSYQATKARTLGLVLIGIALLTAVGIAWDLLELWSLRAEVRELAGSVERLRDQEQRMAQEAHRDGNDLSDAAVARLPTEVAFINQLIEKRTFSWTQFLSQLEQTVPLGVGIASVRFDPKKQTILVVGSARSFEDVTAFLSLLNEHPQFHEPLLRDHHGREDGVVEFHLALRYERHD